MCAVMLWDGSMDEIDRKCMGMVVEETGMIGNDMAKEIKNWETQNDKYRVGRAWSRFITFEMELPE